MNIHDKKALVTLLFVPWVQQEVCVDVFGKAVALTQTLVCAYSRLLHIWHSCTFGSCLRLTHEENLYLISVVSDISYNRPSALALYSAELLILPHTVY